MFNHYRIPRENLLNRTGDVTPEGEYESVFSEPGRILGAALESFSAGRLGIMQVGASFSAENNWKQNLKQKINTIKGKRWDTIECGNHFSAICCIT